ncbi:hypothetical protein F4212_01380 [Candidatus Poribacteria bacterium]|nr:hypothetical protein [Candidatus Poribacteria bacterium]
MANFAETQSFDSVRIIETNDPVLGGNPEISGQVNSPANYAYRALVNRTAWLKAQLEALVIPPAPGAASTTVAGIVRLSTIGEAEAGALATVAVTPAGLQAALNALDIGGVDFATNPEVQAGTVTDKAVSPAGLSSRTATETRTGLVAKATSSEATARTNNQKYMTPLRTDAAINARNATESRRGSIEIATTSEATGGTDDTRAMTSEKTLALLRHSNAQATTSQRGTAIKATTSEVNTGTNNEKYITPSTLSEKLNGLFPLPTVSGYNSAVSSNTVDGLELEHLLILDVRVSRTRHLNAGQSITDNVGIQLNGIWEILHSNTYNSSGFTNVGEKVITTVNNNTVIYVPATLRNTNPTNPSSRTGYISFQLTAVTY